MKMRRCFTDPHYWKNPALRRSREKTSKNEPKHGPKNGTAWRSHFGDRMHNLVKEQKKSTFTSHFWDRQAVPKMRPQNRKIHSKGRPLQQTKNYNCIYLSNQHIDLEQRRPAHAILLPPQPWHPRPPPFGIASAPQWRFPP